MPPKNILIQFDTDDHASVFDRVVAVDAGVDHLFSYESVNVDNVTGLVHGAMFTRGPATLKHSAIFVGGSEVAAGEALLAKIQKTFFGPISVSVMMDSNGCNTTAAAAVVAAAQHLDLKNCNAIVLGATGPVGLRAAELLASEGACVTAVSRSQHRAQSACEAIRSRCDTGTLTPAAAASAEQVIELCKGKQLIIAAGAAGICLLPEGSVAKLDGAKLDGAKLDGLKVAIDLNAVPPVGIADIAAPAKAVEQDGVICYGALGVGGIKMKVHKAAIQRLFESNDRVYDTKQIYELACEVSSL